MDSIRCKLGPHSVVSRSRRRATFRPVHIPCLLSQHLAACDASAWPRVDDEGLDRGISSFIAQAVEGCTKDSYLADRPYAFVVSTSGFNIGPAFKICEIRQPLLNRQTMQAPGQDHPSLMQLGCMSSAWVVSTKLASGEGYRT